MAWNINSIPDKTKGEMYKALASKSYAQVAVEYKIDIHYKDQSGYRHAVYRIAKEVESNPEKFGISDDIIKMVKTAQADRKANPASTQITEPNDSALIDFKDVAQVTLSARNKAAEILHKKMDLISSNRKELEKINLVQLTTAFGTLFDKARIIQGEATENIAIKAKISKDMTPEEALDQLLSMREQRMEEMYEK